MDLDRRSFIRTAGMAAGLAGLAPFTSPSFASVLGANDKVRIGVVGFSDRFRQSLLPAFLEHCKTLNFDIVGVADLWSVRRDEGKAHLEKVFGHEVAAYRNADEMYAADKNLNGVIISTADFNHAMVAVDAMHAGMDAYIEKPLAETMSDARAVLKAVRDAKKIVQIGSQRRSGANYIAAADFVKKGAFGPVMYVDLVWNVNQPGRWRRPKLVEICKEADTDWKRYLVNRPFEAWDPRKYLEYRLFWPYSSGIPGQWMSHQIDTVHWFTGLNHPRSAVANGGIYCWKDGRTNADTMTTVFDYGPDDKSQGGFQVVFSSRFSNSMGGTKEIYYSNGGTMDLDTGKVTPDGGLEAREAAAMGMKPNLLSPMNLADAVKIEAGANTGNDPLTSNHMRNWMECVRSRQEPHAPVEAGFHHSIATIMANAAYRTGLRVTYDEKRQEVVAGDKVFQY
jgi:predicted dehydrogenase